jgi:hypothetical protein
MTGSQRCPNTLSSHLQRGLSSLESILQRPATVTSSHVRPDVKRAEAFPYDASYPREEHTNYEIVDCAIVPLVNGSPYLFIDIDHTRRETGRARTLKHADVRSVWKQAKGQSANVRWVKGNWLGIYISFANTDEGMRDALKMELSDFSVGAPARRPHVVAFPDSVEPSFTEKSLQKSMDFCVAKLSQLNKLNKLK